MRQNKRLVMRSLAGLGLVAAALTGLELGIRLAAEAAGVWGVLAASALFPATIAGAPLLALAWGQWSPAVVVYGGSIAGGILFSRYRAGTSEPDSSPTS